MICSFNDLEANYGFEINLKSLWSTATNMVYAFSYCNGMEASLPIAPNNSKVQTLKAPRMMSGKERTFLFDSSHQDGTFV
jgi:hypothetical protein